MFPLSSKTSSWRMESDLKLCQGKTCKTHSSYQIQSAPWQILLTLAWRGPGSKTMQHASTCIWSKLVQMNKFHPFVGFNEAFFLHKGFNSAITASETGANWKLAVVLINCMSPMRLTSSVIRYSYESQQRSPCRWVVLLKRLFKDPLTYHLLDLL